MKLLATLTNTANPAGDSSHINKVAHYKYQGHTYEIGESADGYLIDNQYKGWKADGGSWADFPEAVADIMGRLIDGKIKLETK